MQIMLSLLAGCGLGCALMFLLTPRIATNSTATPQNHFSFVEKTGEQWSFTKVMSETTGHEVISYEEDHETHESLKHIILKHAETVREEMSAPSSPIRRLKRINEASRYFEDRLRELIDQEGDFSCAVPKTQNGKTLRSGYPDLRIEHLPSKTVAYLDPKLFEEKSLKSSFRSFYYEPNQKNLKVTTDALHFLIGFAHDGKTRAWNFSQVHFVDLSTIDLKLKTEFSASNRTIYQQLN